MQQRLAHVDRSAQPDDGVGGDRALGDRAKGKARSAHFRDDFPAKSDAFATFNRRFSAKTMDRWVYPRATIADMPAELKQVIEENK